MTVSTGASVQLMKQVEDLARAGLEVPTFAAALVGLLQTCIPHAAACVVMLDPATRMLTGSYKFGGLANAHGSDELWAQIEYGTDDPTRMSCIAQQDFPALAASQLRGGTTDSIRMNELVHPGGYSDELRMVAQDAQFVWGGVNLFRAADERVFNADEVLLLGALSGTVAQGLQSGLMVRNAAHALANVGHGPAVMLVGDDSELKQVSVGAEALLDHIGSEEHRSPVNSVIHGLVASANRYARGEAAEVPRVRLRTPSGKWLIAQGSPLASADQPSGDVIVVIDEARSPEVASLVASSFGLTAREREVAELALRGMDTKGIAAALFISPYTVQDHLRAIFDKAGVRSRRELMAKVFFDH